VEKNPGTKLKDRERKLLARATCSFGVFADTHLMKSKQSVVYPDDLDVFLHRRQTYRVFCSSYRL